MRKKRILLVEDDQNFGIVLKDYLSLSNYLVTLAKDGVEGLIVFKNNDFDLCILDVMMPRKDGFTLAQDIRKSNKEIPIVFLTAKTMKEDILRGYQVGADDYLNKPFDSEVLLHKINAMMLRKAKENDAEEELFEFYKKFQFTINQLLNTRQSYKSLPSIEAKALVYQRVLLTEEPKLKLELMKILKDIFKSEGIEDAFDEELRKSLKQIDETDVPSNFTTFYNQYLKSDEIINKRIKYNNKILHQSKLVNYFNGDYDK